MKKIILAMTILLFLYFGSFGVALTDSDNIKIPEAEIDQTPKYFKVWAPQPDSPYGVLFVTAEELQALQIEYGKVEIIEELDYCQLTPIRYPILTEEENTIEKKEFEKSQPKKCPTCGREF